MHRSEYLEKFEELRDNMVGVVQTYGQEPPHCYNTGILEGTQVSVQMTNALRTNLSKQPAISEIWCLVAFILRTYGQERPHYACHCLVIPAIAILRVRQCTWNKFF